MVEEVLRDEWDVHVTTFLDRLATVHGLQDGEFSRSLLDSSRDSIEKLPPLDRLRSGPFPEGLSGFGDGSIDVGFSRFRDRGKHLLIRGIDGVEAFSALRGDEFAPDEETLLRLDLDHRGFRCGVVFPGHRMVIGLSDLSH